MNNNKAIENPENVCFNCLKEGNVHKIHIPAMGYGSNFDNFSTRIHLCNDCMKLTNPEWWKLEEVQCEWDKEDNHGFTEYKYEKEILNFVKQMPIAGRELFYARYGYGACAEYMSGQDWIDYELDKLSHEKCKEYCMYSPEERKAYNERFPICDKVKFIIYEDNSKGCHCPFGAFGNEDGTAEGHQSSTKCYKCKMFVIRNDNIKTMTKEDFDIYELENKLALKKAIKEFKNKNN